MGPSASPWAGRTILPPPRTPWPLPGWPKFAHDLSGKPLHTFPDRALEEHSVFALTGRKALVTGATGGIGNAIAQALHARGATVAISGTRKELLDELAGKLGERVHVLPCNLSKADGVEALVPAAGAELAQGDHI